MTLFKIVNGINYTLNVCEKGYGSDFWGIVAEGFQTQEDAQKFIESEQEKILNKSFNLHKKQAA